MLINHVRDCLPLVIKLAYCFEHRASKLPNLPLRRLVAAELVERFEFAQVCGHDNAGLGGFGQQVTRILGLDTSVKCALVCIAAYFGARKGAERALRGKREDGERNV